MDRRKFVTAASASITGGVLLGAHSSFAAGEASAQQTGGRKPLDAMDYENIRQLLARYCFCLDFQDHDGFVACFSPDGSFEASMSAQAGIHKGADELRKFAAGVGEITQGHSRHNVSNIVIQGDAEAATAASYLIVTHDYGMPIGAAAFHKEPTQIGFSTSGIYFDQLVKLNGGWLFAKRTFRYDALPGVMKLLGKSFDPKRGFPE
jgi:hypothetical protein